MSGSRVDKDTEKCLIIHLNIILFRCILYSFLFKNLLPTSLSYILTDWRSWTVDAIRTGIDSQQTSHVRRRYVIYELAV